MFRGGEVEKWSPEAGLGRWASRRGFSCRRTSQGSRVGTLEFHWRKWPRCGVWSCEVREGAEKLLCDLALQLCLWS